MKPSADQFSLFNAVLDEPEPPTVEAIPPDDHPAAAILAAPARALELLRAVESERRPRRQRQANKEDDAPLLEPPAITGTPADQSLTDFFLEHGRVPWLKDERKPWTFRGWLMWYVHEAEDFGITPPRWDYWGRTMQAGKLLDEPIPRIEFDAAGENENSAGCKHVAQLVNLCAHHLSDFNRISPLLEWMLFGLGISRELPDFPPKLHEALYRTLNLEHFLKKPCDYLGAWIGANKGRWNPTAFFATPHCIVEMMTQMLYGDGDHRRSTVCEPSLGTGRMLLHASNHSLRLHGQDVDHTVILACKVNGALYAPWLVRPFPEEIFK